MMKFAFLALLPVMAAAEQPVRIIALGDSNTATRGTINVYANRLQEALLDVRVANAGIGGHDTNMALLRLHKDVLSQKPDIVTIMFGINDAAVDVWKDPPASKPRVPLYIYEANLRHFVRMCRRVGATPILMTPTPLRWSEKTLKLYGKAPYKPDEAEGFNVLLPAYADSVRRIAKEEKARLFDAWAAFNKPEGGPEKLLLTDGMHLNDAGHELIAKSLLPLIRGALANPLPKPEPIAEVKGWTDDKDIWYPHFAKPLDVASHSTGPFVRMGDSEIGTAHHAGLFISQDRGKTWTRTATIGSQKQPVQLRGERTMLKTTSGVLILAYLNTRDPNTHWKWNNVKNAPAPGTRRDTWVSRSLDDGATWEEPQHVIESYSGAVRDIVQMKSGRIVLAGMEINMKAARHMTTMFVSDDDGATWKRGDTLDIGGRGHHDGSIEPTLAELKDGRLWMLLRTNLGCFYESFSTDGLTWSPMKATKIGASSAPAMVSRLDSGRLVLIWNDVYPQGETNFVRSDKLHSERPASWQRGELLIAFSEDEGQTWTKPAIIARKPKAWLSYPYVFEPVPGELWITTMQTGVRAKVFEKDLVN